MKNKSKTFWLSSSGKVIYGNKTYRIEFLQGWNENTDISLIFDFDENIVFYFVNSQFIFSSHECPKKIGLAFSWKEKEVQLGIDKIERIHDYTSYSQKKNEIIWNNNRI